MAEAVQKGLAPDKGLYMPEKIARLPEEFFETIGEKDFHDIATTVATAFFGDDIPAADLEKIVCDTLSFDTPLVNIHDNIYSLELFHGPTLAFKDVGGRFMARMLSWFIRRDDGNRKVTVIVATSGDTGSAVANGFLGVEGIDVIVLYPKGKVRTLTSANSINVARFLPQAFYYFNAYAQLQRAGKAENVVFCVPSGNFGNITAGLIAWRMGLPAKRFIAANNRNDVFFEYLRTGVYTPRVSVQTIANAMDVGDPSNFARVMDLYGNSVEAVRRDISGCRYTDEDIRKTIAAVYSEYGYVLDPHGACGYQGLADNILPEETGVFLETAHPAKFKDTVEKILGKDIAIPAKLQEFMKGEKQSVGISADFRDFKDYLKTRA